MQKNTDEMSFLDHLEVLRGHLIRVTIAVLLIAVFAFIFKGFIFDEIIFAPQRGDFVTYQFFCELGKYFGTVSDFCNEKLPFEIQNRTVTGQFSVAMWTSIWAGVIIGFPYLIYEMWRFISPGLYEKERKMASRFILVSSGLFFLGVLFGYYLITPLSISFFANFSVSNSGLILNKIDISSYISMVRSSVISCGVVFELPVIIYFLARMGIVTPEFLRKYRKHAVVLILFVAAIITPPMLSVK